MVQRGKGKFGFKITNRVSLTHLNIQGVKCRVLYDKKRKVITTFLPDRATDAIASALAHYDLKLNDDDVNHIIYNIQNNRCYDTIKINKRMIITNVMVKKKECRVKYDMVYFNLVEFLPEATSS